MKKRKYTYSFQMPAVTVDTVLFAERDGRWHVLLIKRKSEPFKDKWALPGGFAEPSENLEQAARRELEEETGIKLKKLQQLKSYGDPGRDPRGWTITVAHGAVVDMARHRPTAQDDAADASWVPLKNLKNLAFDHAEIIKFAKKILLTTA